MLGVGAHRPGSQMAGWEAAVAKTTPLYRIDGAFAAVRKAVLNGKAGEWGENIDVEEASLTSLTAPPMIIYGPHLPP